MAVNVLRTLVIFAAVSCACSAQAQVSKNRVSCDQSPRTRELLKIYDLNGNGCLDEDEKKVLMRDLAIAQQRPKEAEQPKATQYEGPPPDSTIYTTVLIRDAYAANAFLIGGQKLSDDGATFSYTHDYVTSQTNWAGKGSVMLAIHGDTNLTFTGDPNTPRVTYFGFLSGIEFDRQISSAAPKNQGSVSAKGGLEIETLQGGELIWQYFKADSVYTTDYGGKASIFSFETMWQPIANTWPIGKHWSINEQLGAWIYFGPTLNIDYTYVGDNGPYDTLTPGTGYLWVGPKVQATLYFDQGFLKPISLSAKVFYLYETLRGGTQNIDYQQYSAGYKLIETSEATVGLKVQYTHGNTPRTLENRKEFYAGLDIKLGELQPSK
jgi:hypothetical protein